MHALGLRYRVEAPLAGMPRRRADVLFRGSRVAVFVDGCFWHSCPEHATVPVANGSWWATKLAGNAARDRDTDARLAEQGWLSVRVWEHEDMAIAASAIRHIVRSRRLGPESSVEDPAGPEGPDR